MKKPFISKKIFKQRAGKCALCPEHDYDLLDVHRWGLPGSKGGKYQNNNCICLCTKCHRLLHKGKITIHGIYLSTMGKVIHFTNEDDEEGFLPI